MSRQCDATGCQQDVVSGKFMCLRHWRMVPIEIQRTVNDRHRATRRGFGFLADETYLGACVRAIDHVAAREGKPKADNCYARLLRVVLKRKEAPNANPS